MRCPECNVIVLNSTTKCRCGYDFIAPGNKSSRTFEKGIKSQSAGKNATANERNKKYFSFQGKWFDLFAIYIVNILLIVLTVGIYYFWGKVKIKRFLYSNTEFDGDRFAFNGTGWELFRGGIIAICLFIIYSAAQYFAEQNQQEMWAIALSIFLTIILLLFIPFAIILSHKYYLSRTSYRGIRFSFRGKVSRFILLIVKGAFLNLLTLGFYYPYFANQISKYFIDNSYFGNECFRYKGRGSDIFRKYILAFIITIALYGALGFIIAVKIGFNFKDFKQGSVFPNEMLGLIAGGIIIFVILLVILWTWFKYWLLKYRWNNTHFMTSKFRCTFKFYSYLKLITGNIILLVFSIGLLWPLVTVRNIKFLLNHLILIGNTKLEDVQQDIRTTSATGESIADFMDIGSGIDLGI